MADEQIHDLIVLGAGATAGESEYFGIKDQVTQGYLLHNYFSSNRFEDRYKTLALFFEQMFDIEGPDEHIQYPTFEETLGIIELALEKRETFNPDFGFDKIRTDLVYAIAETLAKSLEPITSETHDSLHHLLLQNLHKKGELPNIGFMTLNYDIIIDNAILNFDEMEIRPDYGFEIPRKSQAREFKGYPIPLYKLHGSLNWLWCPTCKNIRHFGTLKFDPSRLYRCHIPDCKQISEPVIIPPTYLKKFTNPYLRQTWFQAEKRLRNVKRVFFCGYSFPDADIQVKYLLKRLQMNRTCSDQMQVFLAINNGSSEPFERFFGFKSVKNLKMDFEEFVHQIKTLIG